MGKYFYPAYLAVGTRRGLQPRKDFMEAALNNKQAEIRAAISASLGMPLLPGIATTTPSMTTFTG